MTDEETKFNAVRLSECKFDFRILHKKIGFLTGEAESWDALSRMVGPLCGAGWFLVSCTAKVDVTDFVGRSVDDALRTWREANEQAARDSAGEAGAGEDTEARPTEESSVGAQTEKTVPAGE